MQPSYVFFTLSLDRNNVWPGLFYELSRNTLTRVTVVCGVCPDYEAALKKEGGVPEGPVLESLLSGELLDKKVETKEEEPMSECQVKKDSSAVACSP